MAIFPNAERDAADLAKLVNEDTDVTTRYGENPKKSFLAKQKENDAEFQSNLSEYQNQVDSAIDKIAEYAPRVVGDFTDGFEFTNFNEVGRYDDGLGNPDSVTYWSYNGSLPFTVPASTVPTPPTYNERSVNDHGALINRNAVGAHDDIYNRRFPTFTDLKNSLQNTPVNGVLETENYSTLGDGGGAKYKKDGTAGTPSTGDEFKFYDINGNGWAILNSNIKSEMFGNDMTKLQDAFNAAERGIVTLKKDAALNRNGSLNLPKLTTLNLNGATLNISVDGNVRGLEINERSTVKNGNVFVNGTNAGGGGANHAPISGGNQGTGLGVIGAIVENVNVDTNRQNGNGIVLFGESRKCKIKNIGWPDSATMSRVVALEWGGPSTGNNNGHPHDNEVKNISGGQLTTNDTSSYAVWLSSCFNIEVTNVFSPNANGCVGVFTGDEAAEYASLDYKDFVGSGIVINNPSGKYRKYGCRVYGKGSNVIEPLFERPIINNPNFQGDLLDDGAFGVLVEFSGGVIVNNPNIRKFGYGLSVGQDGQNVQVNGGDIYENRRNGIRFGNIAGISDCFVNNTRVYKNNQAGGSGVSSAAGVALAYASQSGVKTCKFGLKAGEVETQQYSIYVEPNCSNCDITDNHTYAIKAGGVAYVNGTSSSYDMNTTGVNNTVESGITLSGGAPTFQIDSLGRRHFIFSGSSGFPVSGTWQQGDSFYYSAPIQSGGTLYYIGGVYTSGAGWVNYGQIV